MSSLLPLEFTYAWPPKIWGHSPFPDLSVSKCTPSHCPEVGGFWFYFPYSAKLQFGLFFF